jgi:sulfur-carrier protein
MAHVHLPRSLVALFPEPPPRHLELEVSDVNALVRALDGRWPGMWDRLCEPGPRLREHINVFVDGERVALDAPVGPASAVHVIPAIAGG